MTGGKHHKILGAGENVCNTRCDYPLYRAMRKYDISNFSFDILEQTERIKLNSREEYYIQLYHSDNPACGYNCAKRYKSIALHPISLMKLLRY